MVHSFPILTLKTVDTSSSKTIYDLRAIQAMLVQIQQNQHKLDARKEMLRVQEEMQCKQVEVQVEALHAQLDALENMEHHPVSIARHITALNESSMSKFSFLVGILRGLMYI